MLGYFFPFFTPDFRDWSTEARLLSWLVVLWIILGFIVLFSASYPMAVVDHGDGLYYIKRQLMWLGIGLFACTGLAKTPLRYVLEVSPWLLLLFLGLILMTLIPGMGTTVNGATRWIAIGPFPLQPSELIKPFLVLQGARVFGAWQQLRPLVRGGWLLVFAMVLMGILKQPNLSTTALCGMTLWLIAVAGGLRLRYLGSIALIGVLTAFISVKTHDYQWQRIISFRDPWADPLQHGYQLIQSLLAVGSGGHWGTGFGLSQQKLFYLPFSHTDFIFAVFAEEFGLVGSGCLLLLLCTFATMALLIALRCQHGVYRLIAMGTTIILVGQSLLNIGVAIGALPTTGLPLPLFSYGGSSVIASLILLGLLIRVARESREALVVKLPQISSREVSSGRINIASPNE